MDADRNLLFGVLALQADLIDRGQFVEACTLWGARKSVPLADLLVERGWLLPDDRAHVDYLVERKLRKHGGDVSACRRPRRPLRWSTSPPPASATPGPACTPPAASAASGWPTTATCAATWP